MFHSWSHFLSNGGPFMVPLGICSILSVTIILERAYALRRSLVFKESLIRAIDNLHHGNDITAIDQLSKDESTSLCRLVRSCLNNMTWSKFENTEALQTKARAEISQLERGLVILEIVVGIGPLLGLLGTVSGLITIFANVGDQGLATQGVAIARGIAEALNTTVAGLVVAIPSLIAYTIYSRQVDKFAVELESLCVDLLGKLYSETESVET